MRRSAEIIESVNDGCKEIGGVMLASLANEPDYGVGSLYIRPNRLNTACTGFG
jgi:hypothetical protein